MAVGESATIPTVQPILGAVSKSLNNRNLIINLQLVLSSPTFWATGERWKIRRLQPPFTVHHPDELLGRCSHSSPERC